MNPLAIVRNHRGPRLSDLAIDGAVGAGASATIGYIYATHRDKWYGRNAASLAAFAGKALSALGIVFRFPGAVNTATDAIGQAGINAVALKFGMERGMKKRGYKVKAIPAGADDKTLPAGTEPLIGAGERSLSFDQIEQLASMS